MQLFQTYTLQTLSCKAARPVPPKCCQQAPAKIRQWLSVLQIRFCRFSAFHFTNTALPRVGWSLKPDMEGSLPFPIYHKSSFPTEFIGVRYPRNMESTRTRLAKCQERLTVYPINCNHSKVGCGLQMGNSFQSKGNPNSLEQDHFAQNQVDKSQPGWNQMSLIRVSLPRPLRLMFCCSAAIWRNSPSSSFCCTWISGAEVTLSTSPMSSWMKCGVIWYIYIYNITYMYIYRG